MKLREHLYSDLAKLREQNYAAYEKTIADIFLRFETLFKNTNPGDIV